MTPKLSGPSEGRSANRELDENLEFEVKSFDQLTVGEFHDVLRLRIDVFVVEQQCPYAELDGRDVDANHLLCSFGADLVAYARWYRDGDSWVLGRILTRQDFRRRGLGRRLMAKVLESIGDREIRISAQLQLEPFYRQLGFRTTSQPYDDAGIRHVDMIRSPRPETAC